ncbi:MAG: hypothetical protein RBR99_01705 [Dehalococcoidales bacterium]|jgi:hypothetical protein|nr:hypothetical protein [Dehalococcoidales bacterium]MDX9986162.1 hypothetical protein [Dehalococcoidales bacterium]
MASLKEYIEEYQKQLEKGVVQKAYQGLMGYVMDLRMHFSKKYPDFAPGNIYQGYMDMTYFPIFPIELTSRKLKIAIVLIHEKIRFEIWLAAQNKQIQSEYRKLFKEDDWTKYRIPAGGKGVDSIVEYTLADNPDFGDLNALTKQIEKDTLAFIDEIEDFLYKHHS